jgi:hypothetical protein
MIKKALYMSSLEEGEGLFKTARSVKASGDNSSQAKELFTNARFLFEKALAVGIELNQMSISTNLMNDIRIPEHSIELLKSHIDACKKAEDEIYLNKSMPSKKSKARMKLKDDSDSDDDDGDGGNGGRGSSDNKGLARPNSFLNKDNNVNVSASKGSAASIAFPKLGDHDKEEATTTPKHQTREERTQSNIVFL